VVSNNLPFLLDGNIKGAHMLAAAATSDAELLDPSLLMNPLIEQRRNSNFTVLQQMIESNIRLRSKTSSTVAVPQQSIINAMKDMTRKLDMSKVIAAAGGGAYDEETDPLNAPEVLEAVTKFKKSLEDRDSKNKKRRHDIVDEKLATGVEELKELRKKKPTKKEKLQDSGRRGVSNLPAWMTQPKEVTLKDFVVTLESLKTPQFTKFFSTKLTSKQSSKLKEWITGHIVDLLGEEETTLIEFLYSNTTTNKMVPQDLINELKLVLEEDAEDFIIKLYKYIQTLLLEKDTIILQKNIT